MAESIVKPEAELPRLTDSISIGVLARVVRRETVEEVLAEARRKERRVRLLPAHVVVYFVIAMAIFQDGYEEVMRRLVGGLQFMRAWRDEWVVPTTGAVTRARSRLGEAPMKLLFDRVAKPLADAGTPGAWLGGRRLMAIDGVQIDVPDTRENVAEFGIAKGGTRRPFPQIRVVGLGECSSHAVVIEGYEDHRTAVEILGPHLAHVHVKNAAYDRPPGGGVWTPRWTPMDDGILDVPQLLQVLADAEYQGWVSIEDFSTDRTPERTLEFDARFLRRHGAFSPCRPDGGVDMP